MDGHLTALLGGADADLLASISILARTRMRFAEPRRLRVAPGGSAALRVGGAVRVASMARRARRSSLRPASPATASASRDRIGWRPAIATGPHRPRVEVGATVTRPRPPCLLRWS